MGNMKTGLVFLIVCLLSIGIVLITGSTWFADTSVMKNAGTEDVSSVNSILETPSPTAYLPHVPIHINGNGQFVVGINGVVSGTGIPSDPYIIEGWEINTASSHGIFIENTDVHFIIRDCYVHGISTAWCNGIYLSIEKNGVITKNNVSNNKGAGSICSIRLDSCSDNIISVNNITDNANGIGLDSSTANTISDNKILGIVSDGVTLMYSSMHNTISNNKVYSNAKGIYIEMSSTNNIISNNQISNNDVGVHLDSSGKNTLWSNTFLNDGVYITGSVLSHYFHTIPTNNTVNGKPINYQLNQTSITIDSVPTGQLFLVNCTNSVVMNLNISNTYVGIETAYCANIAITNSEFYNNFFGIKLDASESMVSYNIIAGSQNYGIVTSSGYNRIHHNNLIGNNAGGIQTYDNSGKNFWNTSNEGNHWSDWTSPDTTPKDGIVDQPYVIDVGMNVMDFFPLVNPIKNAGPVVPEPSPAPLIIVCVLLITASLVHRRSRIE